MKMIACALSLLISFSAFAADPESSTQCGWPTLESETPVQLTLSWSPTYWGITFVNLTKTATYSLSGALVTEDLIAKLSSIESENERFSQYDPSESARRKKVCVTVDQDGQVQAVSL